MFNDSQVRKYLEDALNAAEKALELGNYPIGSVFTDGKNEIIEMNECSTLDDVTAHAEMLGMKKTWQ